MTLSSIYELIGRLVVAVVRWRFGKQIRIAAGVIAAGGLVAAYLLASRGVEEG